METYVVLVAKVHVRRNGFGRTELLLRVERRSRRRRDQVLRTPRFAEENKYIVESRVLQI